jgi:hypothetical protein
MLVCHLAQLRFLVKWCTLSSFRLLFRSPHAICFLLAAANK